MTSAVRRFAVLVCCGVTAVEALAQGPAPLPTDPTHVLIIGDDYAFLQVPTTLKAGRTLLAFENHGRARHEMSVALLQPGVTLAQVMEAGLPGAQKLLDRSVGILIARPGEAAGGELSVDLQSGRTYLVVCTLKDTPDAPPHAQMGMVASFRVP